MSIPERDRLRQIKTFPSLVKYLRDELGWPIESSNFDNADITFDYTPEELGLDPQTAVKIEEIKQLRPLVTNQPWGIFFIKFAPKQLPIVALRRILGQLVFKNRASSRKSDRASWNLHDLLFISNYGEGEERQITFAHFTQEEGKSDLPALKVLGWDDEDTALHIDDVHEKLKSKLFWPANESDLSTWRKNWAEAFVLRPREVIATSKDLAIRLADLAKRIRRRASRVMKVESERGPLRKLHKAFREALIHDLSEDDFADMYAQTITYGLFSSAVFRPARVAADITAQLVPMAKSFLKEMLQTFLAVGGRKDKLDFDELGIQEVVELLNSPDTHMEAILRDFDNRNPQEDPVIHFYEHFLAEYDKQMKVSRGVFYTPKPVVSYIVRSVHELLQSEFGLEDGLASTITWAEMAEKNKGIEIPKGTDPGEAFVQILDPATGTGTFLVEAIDMIYCTMTDKWSKLGNGHPEIDKLWNEYVPKHLLPRLHGYELIMAPYAIAHIKIGLKLLETGYRFKSTDIMNIYLTNSLEPPSQLANVEIAGFFEPLANEAKAVNAVKRHKRFTVVIGNPPYSHWSANLGAEQRDLVEVYKYVRGERIRERGALQFELNIQDDYIKFIRIAEILISSSGVGITGMITNNAYLDSATFRGLRWHLLGSYDLIRFLNLHGSVKATQSVKDENVFDIQQGVTISIASRRSSNPTGVVEYSELIGLRNTKYQAMLSRTIQKAGMPITPRHPDYLFLYRDESLAEEYETGFPLDKMFTLSSSGIKTNRDGLTIAHSQAELDHRMEIFFDSRRSDSDVAKTLAVENKKYWTIRQVRKVISQASWKNSCTSFNYRPFDERRIVYHSALVFSPRRPVMVHLGQRDNLALLLCRQQIVTGFTHVFVTRNMFDCCFVSNRSRENTSGFPLYLCEATEEAESLFSVGERLRSNLTRQAIESFQLKENRANERQLLNYIYAILHSPSYRKRYVAFLKRDFPRIPFPISFDLFCYLARFGGNLIALHLMESPKLDKHITKFVGKVNAEVERVVYSDQMVWVNKTKTTGFKGVSENTWYFHIGSYQVCEKWLKDRKGRKLSKEDIEHYQKIIVALSETIKIMTEIDKVIDAHGGWPGAFATVSTKEGANV